MNNEQIIPTPIIPIEDVRRVVDTRYLFSDVVKKLAEEHTHIHLGMSAIRDALLKQIDQMIQDDEAIRFTTLPIVPTLLPVQKAECMYFVKN